MAKKKSKPKREPGNKRPVEVVALNTRVADIVAEVFKEMCRRRGCSYRVGLEQALQKWCGVDIDVSKPPAPMKSKVQAELDDLL